MKITEITDLEYTISDLEITEFMNKQYCIFDFEATGPSPSQDYITQIGACIFDPKEPSQLTTTYLSLVKPNKKIPETIEVLTGITNHDVLSARGYYQMIF